MTDENIKDIENKLILVVDDQGSIRFVVDSYFKEMGFERALLRGALLPA